MQLVLCIGWLESREGPFLGLREMVQTRVLPKYPGTQVQFHSYADDVPGALMRTAQAMAAGGKKEPLILLGHSYGASALFRAAHKMPGVVIDHLIMLDPVPRWLWGQFQWWCYKLPANVKAATCIYNPWSLPKSSPIRGGIRQFRNIKVTPLHASIPGNAEVQGHILEIIHAAHQAAVQPAAPIAVPARPVVRKGL